MRVMNYRRTGSRNVLVGVSKAATVGALALVLLGGCTSTGTTGDVQQFEPIPIPEVAQEDLEPVAPPSVDELLRAAEDALKAANEDQEKGDHEGALRRYNLMLGLLIEADLDPAIFYGLRADLRGLLSATAKQSQTYARMQPPGNKVPFTPGILGELMLDSPLPDRVMVELDEIQTLYPGNFQNGLGRSSKYIPYIREELARAELPEDLLWLAQVESQFSPKVVSRAGAGGMWQFMRSTARHYGLRVDGYVDERFEWRKCTRAAIQYLSELYSSFGSWPLAISAYNMGENGMERAIAAGGGERDLWALLETPPATYQIQTETKKFYAKLLATIIAGKDPSRYGFSVTPQAPDAIMDVPVKGSYSLAALEKACNLSSGTLGRLNPHLVRGVTPKGTYEIAVPSEARGDILAALRKVPEVKYAAGSGGYVVRKGDTLSAIAKKYRVSAAELMRANKLKSANRLEVGRKLVIPGLEPTLESGDKAPGETVAAADAAQEADRAQKTAASDDVKTYQVRPGDTLYEIAKAKDLRVSDLQQWNHLDENVRLSVGQTLRLGPSDAKRVSASKKSGKQVHVVKSGDTPAKVAKNYGVPLDRLLEWNSLGKSSVIQVGDELIVSREEAAKAENGVGDDAAEKTADAADDKPADTTRVMHKAAKGETAGIIAEKYGVGLSKFLAWNKLTAKSTIVAGREYVLYVPQSASGNSGEKAEVPAGTPAIIPIGKGEVAAAETEANAELAADTQEPGEKIVHVVAKGQSPSSIARRYDVQVSDLFRWNGWEKTPTLSIGAEVIVYKPAAKGQ